MKKRYTAWLLSALAISLAGFLPYINSFDCTFTFDDPVSITQNPLFLHNDFWGLFKGFNPRVIGYITLFMNYRLGGADVFGYHLINLFIHIVNGLLVFLLCRLMVQRSASMDSNAFKKEYSYFIPLTAALFFVVHPVQTQAVTYIIQRLASLVTLFYLLTIIFYMKARSSSATRRRIIYYASAAVAAILAIFTKQNAYTLPLSILLVEICLYSPSWREIRGKLIFFGLAIFVIGLVPIAMLLSMGRSLGDVNELTRASDMLGRWEYLVTQIDVVMSYMKLLVLPIGQSIDHQYPTYRTIFNLDTAVSIVIHISIFVIAILNFRKNRLITFGILFFYIALSVESSVFPIDDVFVEHRIYLPSVGFFIALSTIIWTYADRLFKNANVAWIGIFIILCSLGYLTHIRNVVWKSDISLWGDAVAKAPSYWRPLYNLGKAYDDMRIRDKALDKYLESVKYGETAWAWNNIAGIYLRRSEYEAAIKAYERGIFIDTNFAPLHANLGSVYEKLGDMDKAVGKNNEAIAVNSTFAPAYYNLGRIFMVKKELGEAEKYLRLAIDIDADHLLARNRLAQILSDKGDVDGARSQLLYVLKKDPDNKRAMETLKRIDFLNKRQGQPE